MEQLYQANHRASPVKHKQMKTHKFRIGCAFGLNKQRDEIEFEMPEDASEDEIQKQAEVLAWEWASEQLDCWAEKMQTDGDQ